MKTHALDYLQAALELAQEAPRNEHGFLTPEGRRMVLAAYGMVDGTIEPLQMQQDKKALPPSARSEIAKIRKESESEEYMSIFDFRSPHEKVNDQVFKIRKDEDRKISDIRKRYRKKAMTSRDEIEKIRSEYERTDHLRDYFNRGGAIGTDAGYQKYRDDSDKTDKDMKRKIRDIRRRYRKKAISQNAHRQREAIVNSLPDDEHAHHVLRDWHEDNPGHPQHHDVTHLHQYVESSPNPKEQAARRRDSHAHLTRPNSFKEGDRIVLDMAEEDDPPEYTNGNGVISKIYPRGSYQPHWEGNHGDIARIDMQDEPQYPIEQELPDYPSRFIKHRATHHLEQLQRQQEGHKSMSYPNKSAERERQHILHALGQGDALAIHALHDWHQENPGHHQERDVANLRDYVTHGYPGEKEDWTKPDDFVGRRAKPGEWEHPLTAVYHETPEERSSVRARSAHGHLTGRPLQHGDLVHAIETDRHHNVLGTYTGRYHHIEEPGYHPGVFSTEHRAGYSHRPEDLSHHATEFLSRQSQQRKTGSESTKGWDKDSPHRPKVGDYVRVPQNVEINYNHEQDPQNVGRYSSLQGQIVSINDLDNTVEVAHGPYHRRIYDMNDVIHHSALRETYQPPEKGKTLEKSVLPSPFANRKSLKPPKITSV